MESKTVSSCFGNRCFDLSLVLIIFLFFLFAPRFPLVHSLSNRNNQNYPTSDIRAIPLDVLLQDLALQAVLHRRPQTGVLHKASLPANLAGMEISIVRLRSQTLWRRGANLSRVHIPQKTLPNPYSKRILIVYQDFGNWSSSFYNLPGFSLASSVVGFTAYDASNLSSNAVTKLTLAAMDKPIEIKFPSLENTNRRRGRRRCVIFSGNKTVKLSDEMREPNMCYGENGGFFSVVWPLERMKKGQSLWDLWVGGFVYGFVGLAFVCGVGTAVVKFVGKKKVQGMEKQADEDVGLQTVWIGSSKMPSAAVTRTHPVLENASL